MPRTTEREQIPVDKSQLAVHMLLAEKFGSTQAFQVYKIAWEIGRAIATDGLSVVELSCLPTGRPSALTRQFVSFVAYRLDHIPLASIDYALDQLVEKGWLREKDGILTILRDVETEYYRVSDGEPVPVGRDDDPELVLFLPFQSNEDGVTVVGLADGEVIKDGERYMLMVKGFEDDQPIVLSDLGKRYQADA